MSVVLMWREKQCIRGFILTLLTTVLLSRVDVQVETHQMTGKCFLMDLFYGFWDGDYETNMISDCYGSDQVDAIKAMQKFDMVVIYACNNVGEGTE
jgi:hypothetical protein